MRQSLAASNESTGLFGRERGHQLEGILGAIEQTFGGEPLYPTAQARAAHLLYFVIKDHPFSDGNKRIGFATAVLFLEINGARFEAGEVDAVIHMLALAAGELDEPGYSAWHEANMRTTRRRR